jgi:hypothetical protein
MQILPPRTPLPNSPTTRRHSPSPVNYPLHRRCLRWDFGFRCPFCLLSETDIISSGQVSGWAVMTVEHLEPQSTSPGQKNEYGNCVYCCRRCNTARSDRPRQSPKGSLLDPTSHAWADHFWWDGDAIESLAGDLDADYTRDVYDINCPIKIRLRTLRRESIEIRLAKIEQMPLVDELVKTALSLLKSDPGASSLMIQAANEIRKEIVQACRDLQRYRAVPPDADAQCRCKPAVALSLPPNIEEHLLTLPNLVVE